MLASGGPSAKPRLVFAEGPVCLSHPPGSAAPIIYSQHPKTARQSEPPTPLQCVQCCRWRRCVHRAQWRRCKCDGDRRVPRKPPETDPFSAGGCLPRCWARLRLGVTCGVEVRKGSSAKVARNTMATLRRPRNRTRTRSSATGSPRGSAGDPSARRLRSSRHQGPMV